MTGKERKKSVLDQMAQMDGYTREDVARLYIELVAKENGLVPFDGDIKKQLRDYWCDGMQTTFFTDQVEGGCLIKWNRIGARKIAKTGSGKKSYRKVSGKAQFYTIESVEPYNVSQAQWDEHNRHIRNIMSAVSHGKKDPNVKIIDDLEDKQRWDMERIYDHMREFQMIHSPKTIAASERLSNEWDRMEAQLSAIDPRLHYNVIKYVVDTYGEDSIR